MSQNLDLCVASRLQFSYSYSHRRGVMSLGTFGDWSFSMSSLSIALPSQGRNQVLDCTLLAVRSGRVVGLRTLLEGFLIGCVGQGSSPALTQVE